MDVLLIIVCAIFVILIAVLWTLLPFAVFGIKKRLDTLIRLQERALESGE